MDTIAAPTGERRLSDIVKAVVAGGDTVEAHYLEVKSDVELASRLGLAKVVKFILGAANRLPAQAHRHFGGYAVMVIGATRGAADGVPTGTESHELHDKLARYLGAQGPAWDIARLPAGAGHEVLFVIVDPPRDGQAPFPCWADYQPAEKSDSKHSLRNGDVFVRMSSNTRLARAADIEALVRRALPAETGTPVDIEVRAVNSVVRVRDVEGTFKSAVDAAKRGMPAPVEQGPLTAFAISMNNISGQRSYSQEALEDRLDRWTRRMHEAWSDKVDTLAGAVCDGISLHVVNSAASHLPKPHITITLPGCRGIDWTDFSHFSMSELLPPVVPSDRGLRMPAISALVPPYTSMRHYPVSWRNTESGLVIELTPDDLRRSTPWVTDDDDIVVLVDETGPTVTATWVATVEGMGDLFEGEFVVDVFEVDGTAMLRYAEENGRP